MNVLTSVKLAVYDTFATTTHAPTIADVAHQLNATIEDVQAPFDELHQERLLVPEPGDPTRIRMATLFSAIPTPFRVIVGTKNCYANRVWDSIGIPAALQEILFRSWPQRWPGNIPILSTRAW